MTRHVLGIEVLDAGCKTIRIHPHLGDLEWAEGTYPTPLGVIYVKHVKKDGGNVVSTVKAPDGIKVVSK